MLRIEFLLVLLVLLLFTRGSAGADAGRGLTPRVVKTHYPTEDLVIATAVATDYGVKADGATDDSAALQQAIAQVAAAGGGVLFLPEGRYRLDGPITVKETVTLRGDWTSPEHGVKGTILMITGGRGDADAQASITLERGSGLREVSLWWPEQKPDEIVPYPWAIRTSAAMTGDNITVHNVTLVNAYQGIKIGPEWNELHLVRSVYGTILKTGVWIDLTTDIGRLMSVRFSPSYWEASGLPGAPTSDAARKALRDSMHRDATGVEMLRSDWEYFYDIYAEGLRCGMRILAGPNGTSNAVVFGMGTRACAIGLQIDALNAVGLAVTGSRFEADEAAIYAPKSFTTIAQFNTCTFGGKPKEAILLEGRGKLSFQNCTFENWDKAAIRALRGSINAFGCDFRQAGVHLDLAREVGRAHVLGNRFEGAPRILSTSKGDIQISHADFKFERPDISPMKMPPDPRPGTDRLFNVADYGAHGDAQGDNTAAFQRALDAAGSAGGGAVYVPGGNYRFEGRLRVPSKVELRGVFDVPHHTVSGGSVLMPTADRGKEDGPAFIALESHSGVRGITVWHPEQDSNAIQPYPWAIQGQGPGCWVMDIALGNSYQGVDFGTYPSAGHLVRYLSGAPLKTGLWVSKSDGPGWVENVQFNPHYWSRKHATYPFPADDGGDPGGRAIAFQNTHLDGLVFGRCRQENVLGTFIFASYRGIRFVDDGGGANARVIGHGTDGATTDVTFDATGPKGVQMINAEFVPLFGGARFAIETAPQFAGKASLFNTLVWGTKDTGHLEGTGQVLIQQLNSLIGPLTVVGGKVRLENLHFQAAPQAHVRIGTAVKDLLLVGNTGAPFFRFEAEPGAKARAVVSSLPTLIRGEGGAFASGFEAGDPAPASPTEDHSRDAKAECRIIEANPHSGSRALLLEGSSNSADYSYTYHRIYEVKVPIYTGTTLSYWLRPENELGRYVGVDLTLEDGTALRDTWVHDAQGMAAHPAVAKGTVGEWKLMRYDLSPLAGHTIRKIIVAFDSRAGKGRFAAGFDDLRIEPPANPDVAIPVKVEPPAGTYPGPTRVQVISAARVHYTLDGSMPGKPSPVATGPIPITNHGLTELRLIAEDQAGSLGRVESHIYDIQ